MKILAFSKRFIFTLFLVLFTYFSWGQEPINLANCTIEGVSTYNNYTGEVITINFNVKNGGSIVSPSDYSYAITYGGDPAAVIETGKYRLTISGNNENTTGNNYIEFFVISLTGAGTAVSPFIINDVDDWNEFANNPAYWGDGVYVQLDENWDNSSSAVTTMVGYDDGATPFSGTFDGNGKTLNVSYSEYYYNAPFYYTDGATIKNLTVTGDIETEYGYSAGLVYSTTKDVGVTTVQDVTVSVSITDGADGSAGDYCGGFSTYYTNFVFSSCVYNGTIIAGSNSGGFCGDYSYGVGNVNSTFANCIFNPATGSSITGGATFAANSTSWPGCYYTMQVGSSEQGTRLYRNHSDAPSDIIVKPWVILGENVYGPVTVTTTAEETYLYDAGTNYYSTITGCTVKFDGVTVTSNNHYTISVKKNGATVPTVTDVGEYQLVITGKGDYHGTYTKTFYVVDDLTGEGTSAEPYLIRSSADWYVFANKVNNGVPGYASAYYKLTNDITVSTMVGTSENPFSGTFNGQIGNTYGAYTLTFNCGSSYYDATSEEIVAPFRYTNGATIRSLILRGAIHTVAGKEAGLIGVNTRTSTNTTVEYIINYMNFYCYEELWDAEGGGYAYDGSYIDFSYCSYEGIISTSNYHGGFCGNADNTTFDRCLFDPASNSMYWAENFVYNYPDSDLDYSTCYYTIGNNQEESTQGNMVYVNVVPEGNIGHKITTFHEKKIYEPVTVVIGGVNDTYIYTGNDITITPTVTFNGGATNNAITNHYCTAVISPSTVHDVGTYTLTVTAPYPEEDHDYLGTINQLFYVVSGTSGRWTALQARLNNPAKDTIQITSNITAGAADVALSIPAPRTVTIYLNGHTIDRGKSGNSAIAVTNGQVLRIAAGATVTIEGGDDGTIRGGYNIAANNNENANNDGGGISNLGNLTLNNVNVKDNRCKKTGENTSRTARGGGIYSGKNSTLVINGCEITNNSAEGGGGGIFVYQASNFTMNKYDSSVEPYVHGNISKDKGGGIRVDANNSTTAELNDCIINNNKVEFLSELSVSNGGGLHLDGGDLTLNRCEITNNRASKFGGGIYIMGGKLYANNCSINNNMSWDETSRFDGCGGGICLLGGKCYLNGGTITGNSSSVIDGGGIYVNSGTLLSIQGTVNITENWKFISNTGGSTQTTNVYLVKADGKITIAGNLSNSVIGVSKNGNTGVFTSGLNGKGSITNFTSDNTVYSIVENNNEAKLTEITPVDPPTTGTWNINEPVILNTTVPSAEHNVTSIVIGNNGCLYVNTGGFINGVPITNNTTNAENKLVINGGQVITSSSGVPATVKKDIEEAFASSQENWYLISSPLVTPTESKTVVYNPISILDNTNLIVKSPNNYPEYDLYRFNEGATQTNDSGYELQWENYRANHDDFTTLAKGRGYLYRNYYDYTITMTGDINIESSINYALSYNEMINDHSNVFKGFNIIGNPYTHNISKGITGAAIPNTYLEAKYYVLDQKDGSWDLTNDGTAIPPVTGILVQAKSASTLTINNSPTVGGSKGAANNNIWFTVANSKYDDRACVEFRNGRGLNKIAHPNENVPMLYIHHNDEDFASVDMNPEAKQFDLYFEAATLGQYTLTVNPQGNYSSLHLIDKVAEEDIDLLKENEYSFIGSPSDNADRFIVRLELSEDAENSVFAYQSGNDIVVSGEGELQVFDVMGRLIAQKHVSGVESIDKPMTTGVYILRLNGNSQKIVVR